MEGNAIFMKKHGNILKYKKEKNETLVLINQGKNDYFPVDSDFANISKCFYCDNYIFRCFRKVILKYLNFLSGMFFFHWRRMAKKAKKIIVFDSGNANYILKYIVKKFPNKRYILYYWNPVIRSLSPECIIPEAELWSFDLIDCNNYKMNYNHQFYFRENVKISPFCCIMYDAVFLGVDKNRGALLRELEERAEDYKLKFYYHIVKSNIDTDSSFNRNGYKKEIKYCEYLELVRKSKSIIDIVSADQTGMTLRPLEALYYKKKLITNMVNIKQVEFYNPNNIFILGEDDFDGLREFINTDYDMENYDTFVKEYSFETWLKRF